MGPSKSTSRDDQRPASWLHRLRVRARSNRGVAVVEAAFVTPVFFFLILGIVEGGLFMNDYLALSNAVRAGARSASAVGSVSTADMYSVLDIRRESEAIGDHIDYVVIYKASGFGAGPTGTCLTGASVTGSCNVYKDIDLDRAEAQLKELDAQSAAEAAGQVRTLDTTKIWFGCLTSGPHANLSPDRYWCPSDRNDARSDNNKAGPDYVGVYMKVEHRWISKLFGNAKTISDQSVIQIEPRSE